MGFGLWGTDRLSYVTVDGRNYNERQNRRRIRKNREKNYTEVIPGVPQIEFERICIETAKVFKPIINVSINGSSVTCYVRPRILRDWTFHVDFRDNGKSTWNRGSDRSDIAEKYVSLLVTRVEQFRKSYTKGWMESACPNCKGRMIRRSVSDKWYCTSCGYKLPKDAFDMGSKITFWHCCQCGSYLNVQRGFSDKKPLFKCLNCGAMNPISTGKTSVIREASHIVNYCPNCGAHISLERGKFCTNCGMKLQ